MWIAKGPHDKAILAEIKLEHESQMDVDKLTRRFLNIGRAGKRLQAEVVRVGKTPKKSFDAARKEEDKDEALRGIGAMLYNRVFTDAQLVNLMNPERRGSFPALPPKAILEALKETIKGLGFTRSTTRDLTALVTNMSMFEELKKPTKTRSPKPGRVKT